jgi:hypothetical protein
MLLHNFNTNFYIQFSDLLKVCITYSVILFWICYMVRYNISRFEPPDKDRYYIIQVLRHMVLPCLVIKSTDTHWENVLLNLFLRKNNHTNASKWYVTRKLSIDLEFWVFLCMVYPCLKITYFNSCLTFVIMWCVKIYYEMH